jgi:hypothetical protein
MTVAGMASAGAVELRWAQLRAHSRRVLLVALLGVICMGGILRLINLDAGTRSPDERNYTHQGGLVLREGRGAFPILLGDFERDISIPPPTRAGFLYLLAGVMALTRRTDVMAGVWLSCAASIASLALLARLAWRFLSPVAAVFALTFYAVSPLPLMTARRAWQDALVELLALILLLAGAEIVDGAHHWGWEVAFAVTGGACITMKEMPAAVFLLVSGWVLWGLLRDRAKAPGDVPTVSKQRVRFLVFWVGSVGAAIVWLTWLLGDARLLIALPRQTSAYLAASPYSQTYESGSALDLLHGFWIVSPFATLCFPLGLGALALPRFFSGDAQPKLRIVGFLAAFTAGLLATAILVPHHLNFRYLCPAFGPFYLISGLGFSWAAGAIAQRLSSSQRATFVLCSMLSILLCALGDGTMAQKRFVGADLQDLSIRMVLTGSNR